MTSTMWRTGCGIAPCRNLFSPILLRSARESQAAAMRAGRASEPMRRMQRRCPALVHADMHDALTRDDTGGLAAPDIAVARALAPYRAAPVVRAIDRLGKAG